MRLNLGNIYDDYFEYEIMKKYFIIWYVSPDNTYEEEVSVNKYAEAILEEIENSQNSMSIPYSTYVRYYFRMKNMDKFEEICVNAPEVYEELYRIWWVGNHWIEFKICNFKDEDYIDNDTYTKSQYVRWSLGFIEINPKWAVPNNDGMPDRVRPSELDFDSQMKSINKLLFDTNKKPSKCK